MVIIVCLLSKIIENSEYSVDNTVIRELIKTESYTGNSATPEPVKEENKSNSDLDLKKVPNEFKNCRGCGAPFQLVNKHFAGYIDKTVLLKSIEQISLISSLKDESKEIREKIGGLPLNVIVNLLPSEAEATTALTAFESQKRLLKKPSFLCYRCYRWKHAREVVPLSIEGEWKQLKNISKEKALVVLVVDLLDFPSSCLTHIREFVGPHNNIILLINKIDLLKKLNFKNDTLKKDLYKGVLNYATIKKSLPKLVSIVAVSAVTGLGILDLRYEIEKYKTSENVYFVGNCNSGKTSIINYLLKSFSKEVEDFEATPGTVCVVPGTTLNCISFPIVPPRELLKVFSKPWKSGDYGFICDTPGIYRENPIRPFLTVEDMKLLSPKVLKPQTFLLKIGYVLFIGGVASVELKTGDHCYVTVMAPSLIPVLMTTTLKSERTLFNHWSGINTNILKFPSFKEGQKPSRLNSCEHFYFQDVLESLKTYSNNIGTTTITNNIKNNNCNNNDDDNHDNNNNNSNNNGYNNDNGPWTSSTWLEAKKELFVIKEETFIGQSLNDCSGEVSFAGLGWISICLPKKRTAVLKISSIQGFDPFVRYPLTPAACLHRGKRNKNKSGVKALKFRRKKSKKKY